MHNILFVAPILLLWLISAVAETNRTPFDFAEGESELVSGFNVEFGGVGFALLFIAEYASILGLSYVRSFFFIYPKELSFLGATLFSIFWVWLRATLPRYRYDKLIFLAWTSILPLRLGLFRFAL